MLLLSVVLCCCLTLLVILQIPDKLGFVQKLRQVQPSEAASLLSPKTLPKATVILCLRGVDPFLPDCLAGLLAQDYPDYRIQIVVDSPDDPAWTLVNRLASPRVKVSALRIKHPTCSLKCSALLQAVADLEPDCEVVALIDADTIAPSDWLRRLVIPLQEAQVGVTTGNRWYMPDDTDWGSLIRYLWNSSVIVYMYKYRIVWGGSMAVRRAVLHESGVLERWQHSLVEDVTLATAVTELGLEIQPVLSLLLVNRERCDLGSFLRWLQRQFVFVRLYHSSWSESLIYNSLFLGLLLLTLGTLALALWNGQDQAAIWAGSALILNFGVSLLLLVKIHQAVSGMLRDQSPTRFSALALVKLLLALPLSQICCTVALLSSVPIRQVQWRGITYEITQSEIIQSEITQSAQIRLVEYGAYKLPTAAAQTDSTVSI